MLGGAAPGPSPSPRKLAFYLSITHRLTVGYTEKDGTSAILLRRVGFRLARGCRRPKNAAKRVGLLSPKSQVKRVGLLEKGP